MILRITCLLAVAFATSAYASDLSATGSATAKDGDDLIIDGRGYRLSGIDAFEERQMCRGDFKQDVACGRMAKAALTGLVANKQVTCRDTAERAGKRIVAICSIGALDIQEEMVRIGWAFVRPDYAGERTARLCALEAEAARARRGGWALWWSKRPYFAKGGRRKTFEQISCRHVWAR